jgi:serine/threonine protein kinase
MNILPDGVQICPNCGYDQETVPKEVYHLHPGVVLRRKYQIGVVIGFGGFGVVYKAWDMALNRVVAVKEYYPTMYLKRDPGTTQVVLFDKKNEAAFLKGKEEFLAEARNVARYNAHPNIVHVYDFFEENGTAYFVMEYLEGKTLKEYMREAKAVGQVIELDSAVMVIRSVLSALSATHKDNIIHRDIKPGNVFILNDGTVKLFDFGAARFADEDQEMTRTIIITPGYAPPEQYQKKSKQGPYTDIYAVGAMFYEMVTNVKLEESINRKVVDAVKNPREYNSDIPLPINNAIMRALAVQPEIRFRSAEEFDAAITAKKQTRDAKEELHHRKLLRNLKMLALFLVLAGVIGGVGRQYFMQYETASLTETTLQMWVRDLPSTDGLDTREKTEEFYDLLLEQFREDYPKVTVVLTAMERDTYTKTLQNALESGTGPDLFESPENVNLDSYKERTSAFFKNNPVETANYYYLENYESYFPEQKDIPIAVNVPVVYENAMEENLPDSDVYEDYTDGTANYTGTFLDYDLVQTDMAGLYAIREEAAIDRTDFIYVFAVNSQSEEENKNAAFRIVYYLLSDTDQESLTLSYGLGIPLDKNVWAEYVDYNADFEYLTDVLEKQ